MRFKLNLFAALFALGCQASAQAATYVYVANAESQDISVFQLNSRDGSLSPVQTQKVGGTVMPMAVSQKKDLLYASIRTKPFRVLTLAIDPKTGQLSEKSSTPLADNMANIALDHSQRFLFSASYGGNKLAVNPVNEQGLVQEASQIIPTGPMAHAILAAPDNRHVYATVLGSDQLLKLDFDAKAGALKVDEAGSLKLPEKSGPRHFIFSKQHAVIYLIDELDGKLHVVQRNVKTGALTLMQSISAVPPEFTGKVAAADIHMTPNGKYLYASERTSNTLAGFRVSDQDGKLELIGHWPTETQPRGFNISPDGKYLLAVGQKSHQMSTYRINPVTGQLFSFAQTPTGQNPNWVEIIELH